MMYTNQLLVRDVMESNSVCVTADCPLGHVVELMNERHIGSVLVTRDNSELVGIFTDRALVRNIVTSSATWRERPVSEWMTPNPTIIGPTDSWDEAVEKMQTHRVRHLPVVENGRVVGIVSPRLLMARRAEYLNRQIEERTAELRRANDHLLARDIESVHNLRAAGRLQTRLLLPHSPPEWPELRWAVHFAPLDHLGGDYYDFARPDPDRLGFLIADASGHSLPAAMVAIMARFAFAEAGQILPWPGEVLGAMNRKLGLLAEERFVTAVYAVFDRPSRSMRYSAAGHPPPLLYKAANRSVSSLSGTGFLLGVIPDEVYAEKQIALGSGDRIVFYTDGLIEARNEIGELFGIDRLTACLQEQQTESAAELLECIVARMHEFRGTSPLNDDVTIAVVEVLPES